MAQIKTDPRKGLNGAVADELRAELSARRMTHEQLADQSGIPLATLRRYLRGTRHINVDTLSTLATALGTTPAALVRDAARRLARAQQREDDPPGVPTQPPKGRRR
jgi:transcriptional regulator with XRE-family HTH domain